MCAGRRGSCDPYNPRPPPLPVTPRASPTSRQTAVGPRAPCLGPATTAAAAGVTGETLIGGVEQKGGEGEGGGPLCSLNHEPLA